MDRRETISDSLSSQTYGEDLPGYAIPEQEKAVALKKAALQRALAQQKGYTPMDSSGQMISGRYVGNPGGAIANAVLPLLHNYDVSRAQNELSEKESELSNMDRRAAIAHQLSAPQPVSTTTRGPEGFGVGPEGAYEGDIDRTSTAPVTPQQKIQWAEQGMHIPSRRDLLKKLVEDQTIAEPVREEGRAAKREEHAATLSATAVQKEADRQAKREEGEARRAQDEKESARASADRLFIAQQAHLDRRAQIASNLANKTSAKPLSDPAMKDLNEVRSQAQTAGALSGSFKDEYAGYIAKGKDEWAAVTGMNNEVGDWWSTYRARFENPERKALLGVTLTKSDNDLWTKSSINPKMDAKTIRENLATREAILHNDYITKLGQHERNGKNAYEVFGFDPKDPPKLKELPKGAPMSGTPRPAQATKGAPGSQTNPVPVRSAAEARNLRPGTFFVTPSGEVLPR